MTRPTSSGTNLNLADVLAAFQKVVYKPYTLGPDLGKGMESEGRRERLNELQT